MIRSAGDTALKTEDRIMRLSDGRLLGYAEFGDPDGYPVFLFHGIPGSRRGASVISDEAYRRGIRLIGVDRPGIGLSSFQLRRTFLHWPHDVAELADALRFERFGVVGNSGGSAYVSACGALIPERLDFAGIISGMGPPEVPGWQQWMKLSRQRRIMIAVARRAPLLACRIAGPVLVREFDPQREGVLERMKATMAPADAALLDDPRVADAVLLDAAEALRQGPLGVTWDIMMYTQPWGFRLDDVHARIHIWHGEADITVPPIFGRAMEAFLSDCNATYWPDEGHLMAASRAHEIIDTIITTVYRDQAQEHRSRASDRLIADVAKPILNAARDRRLSSERHEHAGDRAPRSSSTDQNTLPGRAGVRVSHHDGNGHNRSEPHRLPRRDARPAD